MAGRFSFIKKERGQVSLRPDPIQIVEEDCDEV